MPELVNRALDNMRKGDLALGIIVRVARASDIAGIARTSDHDFLFIDMQHGAFSLETAAAISIAALGVGIAPVVRMSGYDNLEAARILDNGGLGIVVPDVNTAEQARRAVATCKFKPLGRRSVSGGYPHFCYEPVPVADATRILNENTMLCAMIETGEALENVEEIAAVDGIDVLHMGVNDLLADLGLPGQFGHQVVDRALDRMIAACRANGKFAGLGGDKNPEYQRKFVHMGGQLITTHSDLAYILAGASARASHLRAARTA